MHNSHTTRSSTDGRRRRALGRLTVARAGLEVYHVTLAGRTADAGGETGDRLADVNASSSFRQIVLSIDGTFWSNDGILHHP